MLTRQPFEPFGIYLSDGASYAVVHPDQVIVTPRSLHIGIRDGGENERIAQDVAMCSLIHVTRLGPVPENAESA